MSTTAFTNTTRCPSTTARPPAALGRVLPGDGNCGYYGYKVLGVGYGATLQLYGKKGATYDTTVDPANTGTSWVRLNNCNPSVSDPPSSATRVCCSPAPTRWYCRNLLIGR